MLIRKETNVVRMHSTNMIHEVTRAGIQIAFPIGTTSLMNESERPSAPLENVSMYLSKFSVPDLVSSQTFLRDSSCNSSALVFSATAQGSRKSMYFRNFSSATPI